MKTFLCITISLAAGFGLGYFVARTIPEKKYFPPIPGDNYGDKKVSQMTRAELVEAIEIESSMSFPDWVKHNFKHNPDDEELRKALRQLILENTSIKPNP